MTFWKLCDMEKCVRTSRSKRRITVQIIVDVVIWLFVAVPLLYLFLAGVPYDRGFFCDDDSIKYPYKPDTISTSLLLVLGFGTSVAVVTIVEVLNCMDRKCTQGAHPSDDVIYIVKCYAVFLVGFVVDHMFVEVVKNETGSLRPNFMDVCRPQYNSSLCPGYIMEYKCTGASSVEDVRESRQSFPSGHAAFSMYIAVYFCFYIQKRLNITFSKILKVILQLSLLFVATICGFSRIADHKHHMIDVISGFFLGSFIAVLLYMTVTRQIVTSRGRKSVQFDGDVETDPCSTSEIECNGTDPVTPTPLLSMQYINGDVTGYHNAHPLKDAKYNARRHMSAPNTSTVPSNVV